jgi:hypothetical protein
MTSLKEWCEAQWQKPGVRCAKHGVAYIGDNLQNMQVRAGTQRNYKSKQQRDYEKRFAIYNEKLRPIILAEATATLRNMEIAIIDKYGRLVKNGNVVQTEVKMLNEYRWPKIETPAKTEQAPVIESVPRKRVPKAKLEQAAAIIAKVPQDELATFLARFGLSLSLAASIASLDNAEMIARQFLRATL